MKASKLWMGILAIVFAATIGVVGCGEDPADDNNNGNGNNTGDPLWTRLKNTQWKKDNYWLRFSERTDGTKLVVFGKGQITESNIDGYFRITLLEADKIADNQQFFNYSLSTNGNTLTVSNWTNQSLLVKERNGDYTKNQ